METKTSIFFIGDFMFNSFSSVVNKIYHYKGVYIIEVQLMPDYIYILVSILPRMGELFFLEILSILGV